MNVAILGAGGFIGGRAFEHWQRSGAHRPRAIVRSPSSLARLARFEADWRLADARNEKASTAALEGCDALVHSVVGPERTMLDAIAPAYRAARAAGVRRIVYLSSASVHGQNPPAGTTEDSPLHTRHALGYNNAKVLAERQLAALARDGAVEVVTLRPGVVFGPRSRWVLDVAEALRARQACWLDGGRGVCNSAYVDNVVHGIECALAAPGVTGQAFFVGDAERVTWREFYLGLAGPLGAEAGAFREALPAPPPHRTWRDRAGAFKSTAFAQTMLAAIPSRAKETVKGALRGWAGSPPFDPFALPDPAAIPVASLEMTELFRCTEKLPNTKAGRLLGYRPPVAFAAGLAESVRWLEALGWRSASPLSP